SVMSSDAPPPTLGSNQPKSPAKRQSLPEKAYAVSPPKQQRLSGARELFALSAQRGRTRGTSPSQRRRTLSEKEQRKAHIKSTVPFFAHTPNFVAPLYPEDTSIGSAPSTSQARRVPPSPAVPAAVAAARTPPPSAAATLTPPPAAAAADGRQQRRGRRSSTANSATSARSKSATVAISLRTSLRHTGPNRWRSEERAAEGCLLPTNIVPPKAYTPPLRSTGGGFARVGWVEPADVVQMTNTWECAQPHCPYPTLGARKDVNLPIFVLNCGHFMCSLCLDELKRTTKGRAMYPCGSPKSRQVPSERCGAKHSVEDLGRLPMAVHTMELRNALQQRGILCSECGKTYSSRKTQEHFHSREAMFVCTHKDCSSAMVLENKVIEYDIHSNRKHAIKTPASDLFQRGHELTRLCFLCSKKSDIHSSHEKVPISDVKGLNATFRQNMDKKIPTVNRAPWHLSTLPPYIMYPLLENYVSCRRCGLVYHNDSTHFPVMLNCSHVVCNRCENEMFESEAPDAANCPFCWKKHMARGEVPRKIADLQFAASRDKYKQCSDCAWSYPEEYLQTHQLGPSQICLLIFCMNCIGGEKSRNHKHQTDIVRTAKVSSKEVLV
ncbi:hypothetical protein PFISCL1PPCAC_7052, partial [Pristionchus fissidentatus]